MLYDRAQVIDCSIVGLSRGVTIELQHGAIALLKQRLKVSQGFCDCGLRAGFGLGNQQSLLVDDVATK
jgi:hypothetical protein